MATTPDQNTQIVDTNNANVQSWVDAGYLPQNPSQERVNTLIDSLRSTGQISAYGVLPSVSSIPVAALSKFHPPSPPEQATLDNSAQNAGNLGIDTTGTQNQLNTNVAPFYKEEARTNAPPAATATTATAPTTATTPTTAVTTKTPATQQTAVPGATQISPRMKAAGEIEKNNQPVLEQGKQTGKDINDIRGLVYGTEKDEYVPGEVDSASGVETPGHTVHVHTPGLNEDIADRQKKEDERRAQFELEMANKTKEFKDVVNANDLKYQQDKLDAQNSKIDPDRKWNSLGTDGKIIAALSIAMSGFGAAMPGSKDHINHALEIIDGAVKNDIDAQRDNITNKWRNLQLEGEENKQKYVRASGIRQDMLQLEVNKRQDVADEINNMKGKITDAKALVQLDALGKANEEDIAKIKDTLVQTKLQAYLSDRAEAAAAATKNTVSSKEIGAKAFVLYQDPNFQPNIKDPAQRAAVADQEAQRILTRDRNPGSLGGATVSKPATNGAQQQGAVSNAQDMLRITGEIRKIFANPIFANSPQGRARLDELNREGTLAYPRLNTQTTRINDTELSAGKAAFSGTDGWLRSDLLGRNAATLDQIDKRANDVINSGGASAEAVPGATPIDEDDK